MVNVLLGEIGIWLSASIIASTVICLELTTASTSPINVLRGSSSNILPCVLMKAANTCLPDLICSQMSPIWLLAGGFLSYTIQSELFFLKKLLLLWCIPWKAISSSFSVSTKFLPLQDLIIRILLLMYLLKACIKGSVFVLLQTLRGTALLASLLQNRRTPDFCYLSFVLPGALPSL